MIALSFVSCHEEHAHIQGNISGLSDREVYLKVYEQSLRTIDSVPMIGGRFSFDMPPILPDMVYVCFSGYPDYFIPVILEGQDLYISGNFTYRDAMEVSGSPANEDFRRFREQVRWHEIQLRAIRMEMEGLSASGPDSLLYRTLSRQGDSIDAMVRTAEVRFVRENPASLLSAFLVARQLTDSTNRKTADSLLRQIDTTTVRNAFINRLRLQRTYGPK